MNYSGSQIICSGIKIGVAISSELDYFGSTIKGYQFLQPRIVTDMAVYIYYNNALFDPFAVYYTIFDTQGKTVKYQVHVLASRFSTGWYYANFGWWHKNVITNLKMGTYRIVWEIDQTQFGQASARTDQFSVYKLRNEICSTSTDISSGGSAGGISSTWKQQGTCNTLNYGVGLVVRSNVGCCGSNH
jgi:hypothetical protein